MADLIDRLTHQSEFMVPPRPGIAVHAFAADVMLYIAGKRTNAEMTQTYDLQGDELTQANQIRTVVDGKNASAKQAYAIVVQSVLLLLGHPPSPTFPAASVYFGADGTVNKARVRLDLEIP